MGSNPEANEAACEFLREKIRSIVRNPETAETLCPKDHYYGTKRPCLDTDYFETFNRRNVRLVDLRRDPIRTITETGTLATLLILIPAVSVAKRGKGYPQPSRQVGRLWSRRNMHR